MKVAYAHQYGVHKNAWSGVNYRILKMLQENNFQVHCLKKPEVVNSFSNLDSRLKYHFYIKVCKKGYQRDKNIKILKSFADQFTIQLNQIKPDIIFGPQFNPLAYLDYDKPIVFWHDATFHSLLNFYPEFSNLCKETIRDGLRMEKEVLRRSALAIYSSEWAAKSAIDNYGIDPSKVKVVPYGANIAHTNKLEDIKHFIHAKSRKKCNLLFIGKDWHRKGGELTLEITKNLNQLGLPTELNIVGCNPRIEDSLLKYVKIFNFVDKSTTSGTRTFHKLLSEAHFLVLPSVADATPIVLPEANSFGVPCLATNVGGISTIIKDNINGKTFNISEGTESYVQYIQGYFQHYDKYTKLATSTFNEFEKRLNWKVAGKAITKLLYDL